MAWLFYFHFKGKVICRSGLTSDLLALFASLVDGYAKLARQLDPAGAARPTKTHF
jgi:hypothetical protein